MLATVKRRFVKIVRPGDGDIVLQRGQPERPAARFNRPGQDALYLSPDETSARVAIGQYVTEHNRKRQLLTYEVGDCRLCDLRHRDAASLYELARQPWLGDLEAGNSPASWIAADRIRENGYDGLIDPSRRRPGLWHITLFRWNEPHAPQVTITGLPQSVTLELDFR